MFFFFSCNLRFAPRIAATLTLIADRPDHPLVFGFILDRRVAKIRDRPISGMAGRWLRCVGIGSSAENQGHIQDARDSLF